MALVPMRPFQGMPDPFREIDTMQREMNRIFNRLMTGTEDGEPSLMAFKPAAEIEETDDAVMLRLEIPGIKPKDLEVQVSDEAVSISGERKSESKTEQAGRTRSEFRYGSFQRVIPLPTKIQNDRAKAEYKNGVLHLRLPKSEEEKKRVVKVDIA